MKKFVMFDLDGTLLPMDQDAFVKVYFGALAKKMAPYGYKPEDMIAGVTKGLGAMVKNDGTKTNEDAFWETFVAMVGEGIADKKPVFEEFYRNEFAAAKAVCGYMPKAAETVRKIKEAGYRVGLATNPLFPAIATETRMGWAGLEPEDFEFYTTYENYSYCKPNPKYYEEILGKIGLKAENCIMVGNDVDEDMVASELGMDVFLLTDCLLNRKNKDISQYPQGGFEELLTYLGVQ